MNVNKNPDEKESTIACSSPLFTGKVLYLNQLLIWFPTRAFACFSSILIAYSLFRKSVNVQTREVEKANKVQFDRISAVSFNDDITSNND